jgi:hypothetical protein
VSSINSAHSSGEKREGITKQIESLSGSRCKIVGFDRSIGKFEAGVRADRLNSGLYAFSDV